MSVSNNSPAQRNLSGTIFHAQPQRSAKTNTKQNSRLTFCGICLTKCPASHCIELLESHERNQGIIENDEIKAKGDERNFRATNLRQRYYLPLNSSTVAISKLENCSWPLDVVY